MERVFPNQEVFDSLDDAYRDLSFPQLPASRPYIVLNFVTSVDGQATLGAGGAAGLGSDTDHKLMAHLRACVDGLLHGAGTVRADNFPPTVPEALVPTRLARGLSTQPLGAVVTKSGNIATTNRYFANRPPAVLTTTSSVADLEQRFGERAIVIDTGPAEVNLRVGLEALRTRLGIRHVLCEGGPMLARQLLGDGLLDEIFLTLAPKLGSDRDALRLLEGPAFAKDALPQLDLVHILREGSELFLRYRVLTAQRG